MPRINLPTVDELYLRSQAEVTNLKVQLAEANERIMTMGNNWVRLDIEHDEELSEKQSVIDAWKQVYFDLLELTNKWIRESQLSDANAKFWADTWEKDTTDLEEKIRRLKKKAKKK